MNWKLREVFYPPSPFALLCCQQLYAFAGGANKDRITEMVCGDGVWSVTVSRPISDVDYEEANSTCVEKGLQLPSSIDTFDCAKAFLLRLFPESHQSQKVNYDPANEQAWYDNQPFFHYRSRTPSHPHSKKKKVIFCERKRGTWAHCKMVSVSMNTSIHSNSPYPDSSYPSTPFYHTSFLQGEFILSMTFS